MYVNVLYTQVKKRTKIPFYVKRRVVDMYRFAFACCRHPGTTNGMRLKIKRNSSCRRDETSPHLCGAYRRGNFPTPNTPHAYAGVGACVCVCNCGLGRRQMRGKQRCDVFDVFIFIFRNASRGKYIVVINLKRGSPPRRRRKKLCTNARRAIIQK